MKKVNCSLYETFNYGIRNAHQPFRLQNQVCRPCDGAALKLLQVL